MVFLSPFAGAISTMGAAVTTTGKLPPMFSLAITPRVHSPVLLRRPFQLHETEHSSFETEENPCIRSNQVPLDKIHDAELCPESLPPVKVHVIAHRGASGSMPDHTLEAYKEAFLAGADWIELDAHSTRDHQLVVVHDPWLDGVTDVADWAWAAPYRRRTRAPCYDGEASVVEGWMIKDLTLEQIKQLRVREANSCRSSEYDLMYEVPTLHETAHFIQKMVDRELLHLSSTNTTTKSQWLEERNKFVLKFGRCRPNPNVGLYIETKRPGWYRSIGLPLEEKLVQVLDASEFQGPVIIQSFESDSLCRMQDLKPDWKTVKLLTKHEIDVIIKDSGALDKFLGDLVADGIDGIGPDKLSIIPNPTFPPETSILVDKAHKHGLFVHPYTFRSDVTHLHRIYGGNSGQEFAQFFRLGVDGVFTDFPDHGVFARELYNRLRLRGDGFLHFSDVRAS